MLGVNGRTYFVGRHEKGGETVRRGLGGGSEALEELGAGGLAAEGGGGEPRGRRGRPAGRGSPEGGVRYPQSHKGLSLGSLPRMQESAASRGGYSHEGTNCVLLLKNKTRMRLHFTIGLKTS